MPFHINLNCQTIPHSVDSTLLVCIPNRNWAFVAWINQERNTTKQFIGRVHNSDQSGKQEKNNIFSEAPSNRPNGLYIFPGTKSLTEVFLFQSVLFFHSAIILIHIHWVYKTFNVAEDHGNGANRGPESAFTLPAAPTSSLSPTDLSKGRQWVLKAKKKDANLCTHKKKIHWSHFNSVS